MKLKPVVASLVMLGLMAPAFAEHNVLSRQAMIDQNTVVQPLCHDGWFDRIQIGGIGSFIAQFGNHDPAGYFTNFGNSSDLYVNNFNLLLSAKLSCWSKVNLNLAYLGAPSPWSLVYNDTTSTGAGDKSSGPAARNISHRVVADEAYVTIGDLTRTPFYFRVGKLYVPFGDYSDVYIPMQIMSPTQMLAQTNAVTAIAGVASDFGFYGNIFAFRGETYPVGSTAGNIRNFGAKIGYYDHLDSFNIPCAHVNFALGYINNVWDSMAFTPNTIPQQQWTQDVNTHNAIDPVGAVSAHGDFAYQAFSINANWVGTVKKMVDSGISVKHDNSKFWGADVNADYAFKTLDRDSHLGAGIQWSGNGAWFGENTYTTLDWVRVIPKWRLVGEYKVNLFKNTDLSLVVAHGKSYDFVTNTNTTTEPAGSRNTTIGLARLNVQL